MSQILRIISTPTRGPPAAYPATGRKKTKTGPLGLMATSPLLACRPVLALQSTSADMMREDSLMSPATCPCTHIEHTGEDDMLSCHSYIHSFVHSLTHSLLPFFLFSCQCCRDVETTLECAMHAFIKGLG